VRDSARANGCLLEQLPERGLQLVLRVGLVVVVVVVVVVVAGAHRGAHPPSLNCCLDGLGRLR